MKYIKNVILVVFIIIIIIIAMVVLIKKREEQEIRQEFKNSEEEISYIDKTIKQVDNPTLYYTVYDCFINFYKLVNMKIVDGGEYIEGGELSYSQMMGISSEKEKNEEIYNLLDENYINENNITIENVYKKFEYINNKLTIEKMYIIDDENVKNFYLYITNEQTEEKYLFNVILDVNNKTYSIMPMEMMECDSIKTKDINNIKSNKSNTFEFNRISDEELAMKYFYDYKNNVLDSIEDSYNSLDERYREARFGNINNYKKYIDQNKQEFEDITLKKYVVNNYDEYTEFVCQDQYQNTYIFKAAYVMDYKLTLDTYTIKSDKFLKEYKQSDKEKKVQMNIDKFIQMINRHDYITSYNCLADSFKNNYFETQEKFEEFTEEKFFKYNKFVIKNLENRGNNLYVCDLELTDITEEFTEKKNITIIMQINDDLDFEMSFGIE